MDPDILGPIFWRVIHSFEALNCIEIIPCLLRIFPCYSCRCEIWHLEQVLFQKLIKNHSKQILSLNISIDHWKTMKSNKPITWILHNLVNMNTSKNMFSIEKFEQKKQVRAIECDFRDIVDVLYFSLASIIKDQKKVTSQVETWITSNSCSWKKKCAQYAMSVNLRLEAWHLCVFYFSQFINSLHDLQSKDVVYAKSYLQNLRQSHASL